MNPAVNTPATGSASAESSQHAALPRLQQELLQAVASRGERRLVLTQMAAAASRAAGDAALFDFRRDEQQQLILTARVAPGGELPANETLQEKLLEACHTACRLGEVQTTQLDNNGEYFAFSAPIFLRRQAPEAVSLVVKASACSTQLGVMLVSLLVVYLTLWRVLCDSSSTDVEADTFAALLELLEQLTDADDLEQGCLTLVGQLQQYFDCRRVALGLRKGGEGDCRLQALSLASKFDQRSPLARAIEAALEESILCEQVACWPPQQETQQHSLLAHQKLCTLAEVECVVSTPLLDQQGEPVGAWLLMGDRQKLLSPDVRTLLTAAQRPFGSALHLLERADAGWLSRLGRSMFRAGRSWKFKATLMGVCLLSLVLALPLPYKIGCECVLQPVTRRFVAAPYDAKLEKSLVAPGDLVKRDKVLARIDGRDIRLELAGLIADHKRAAKERDSALAAQDAAEVQLARLEMKRLDMKIQMLNNRIANLEIKSPLEGIVVSGDLEKAEGAPLTTGQTMFEIAPLNKMTVEVALPEDEISYARAGMEVVIRLDAYPGRKWRAEIEKIHPRSEIRDNESVFIAELTLDNPHDLLRPGMNGTAKIVSGRRPLAWNLFHKPWEAAMRVLGW